MKQLVRENVMVEWVMLGEGLDEDYEPGDPNDVELLRFDVSRKVDDDWVAIEDASYCTQVPVSATPEQRQEGLVLIMDEVFELASQGYSIKKVCEWLSWISLEGIEKGMIEKRFVLGGDWKLK